MTTPVQRCPTEVYKGDRWHARREPCGKPIKRRGHCGVHANQLDREDKFSADLAEGKRLRDERRARQSLAANVARFLGEKLGVELHATDDGDIAMTLETAQTWLAR